MTREEFDYAIKSCGFLIHLGKIYYEETDLIKAFEDMGLIEQEPYDFARWVASEIFDDMWEYNKDAFAEIACRKLAKLGIVRAKDNEWELVEPQERSE